MTTVQVFDRPMCCSTGVCGPEVDPVLVRFSSDIEWLRGQGIQVARYNLAQQPGEFAAHADVVAVLQSAGTACLPVVRVNGAIVSYGRYPSRALLARWCGLVPEERPVAASSCCGSSGCC
jgi:hypothetical protein